jgi:aarF domain-containing kinase
VKVPSFADDVAMALVEEELGQPWQNVYSELSPSPIAAGSPPDHLDILLSY